MIFLFHFTLTILLLITIVFSCILFTNAIEFLGNKLKLSNNATGSILAVFGTALPETIVPIIAILGSIFISKDISIGQNIALGAILGSPFMLSTLALFLMGILMVVPKRQESNVKLNDITRDYKYFIFAYSIAFIAVFIKSYLIKIIIALFLIFLYFIFAIRTIKKAKNDFIECDCEELFFAKIFKHCSNYILILQIIFSLLILFISTHLFIEEIKYFAILINIHPALLSFLIMPFAPELPEIINSIIWIKNKKDDLAFANILGAIVFQSTNLFALGLILTPWVLEQILLINFILTLFCAFIFLILIQLNKKITPNFLFFCGVIYFAYFLLIILTQ